MTTDEREMLREARDAAIWVKTEVLEHAKILKGNGNKGHVVDIAGLKAFRTFSCWFYIAIGSSTIGLIYKLVYNHIVGEG